jgi:outer membrane biosynthesis protein TonB
VFAPWAASLLIGPILYAAPAAETDFAVTHKGSDPRFLTSVERVVPCVISSEPAAQISVPPKIYPKKSADTGEVGPVEIKLVFDGLWCVRKATIVKSSGYWRLDQASLKFLMTVRFKPDDKSLKIEDGLPTMAIKLEYRRTVCGGYMKCLYIDFGPAA